MPLALTPEFHRQQIEAYIQELPHYKTYAAALERVFKEACKHSALDATVQVRPKAVSSFAEKCVRKFGPKFQDPVHQFTDLCGARIIVQTLEQVRAVKRFIDANFDVLERDDKASLLGEDRFGYRDMHYLVRLKPERTQIVGLSQDECSAIGERIAEVQVRALVQHAWADIIHDRVYKAPLKLSAEAKRTTALLAAIMEDGDRTFDRLAGELDSMAANYTAYADPEKVQNEIAVQELIFANETDPARRATITLQLARLLAPGGAYSKIVELLEPLAATKAAVQFELRLELGSALCRLHRGDPNHSKYKLGQKYLDEVIAHCSREEPATIRNFRQHTSLLAHACARLAWSWEATVPGTEGKALQYYRQAVETEPSNPYHLSNQLGFEVFCQRGSALIASMRTTIRQAINTCREHAVAGTELPYALFTAGRLSLLLGEAHAALGWYARGLRHFFDRRSCAAGSLLDDEMAWVRRLHFGAVNPPEEHDWIERLMVLVRSRYAVFEGGSTGTQEPSDAAPLLIVAGGAGSMTPDLITRIQPPLMNALQYFRGTVISGGTRSGIPGCIGEIAAALQKAGKKQFRLVGYIPTHVPADAPPDDRYDECVTVPGEKGFSPSQVLQMWENLCGHGVSPSKVTLLGIGGGSLTGVEYRVAFALGATVAVVAGTGGASDEILADPVWSTPPSILPLPFDAASIQALVTPHTQTYPEHQLIEMAQAFHANFLKDNIGRLPKNLRPWGDKLDDTYKTANKEQASYAVEILRASGFDVRPANGVPQIFQGFEPGEIERMAELEHGRWNVERLRNGWRPGLTRDDEAKIHDNIVAWKDLPEHIREYDRLGVRAFPTILAKAGLEVFRK